MSFFATRVASRVKAVQAARLFRRRDREVGMSQPFIGEIRLFGGNFAPQGWNFCNGAVLPISEFEVLFNLIGTTYGGDGVTNFALPDLRSRVPLHQGAQSGQNYVIGQSGGQETVTLTLQQIPAHTHQAAATATGTANIPASNLVLSNQTAPAGSPSVYAAPDATTLVQLAGQSVGLQGGNQPHDNMQPFVALSFIISLFGIFPSQG
jgi:microcystin-dependent protein